MQVRDLASAIAKKEGNKSESRIGDIREIISIMADMSYADAEVIQVIIKLGIARSKRKKKNVSQS